MSENLYFRLKIFEKHGTSFQSFFSDIMVHYNEGFIPVDGASGDGGNDGYTPSQKHYFQVYAPSRVDIKGSFFSNSSDYAETKLEKDFEKLCKNWPEIKHYSFVMNDRFEGQPLKVGRKLLQMAEKYPNIAFNYYGAHRLRTIFMGFNNKIKEDIIGFPIFDTADIGYFDSEALGETILYILEQASKPLSFGLNNPVAPTFDKKLEFNNLSQQFQSELRTCSYQTSIVDEFLINKPKEATQIQFFLNGLYQESKELIPDTESERSDIIYIRLCENMIPKQLKRDGSSYVGYKQAAKVLLAKYFEACDVFEDPDKK